MFYMVLSLGGNTSHHLTNPKRHNNKIANKCRNSTIIITIIIPCRNWGWPLITQLLLLERNTVSESCMVHHICIIMQIKTLSRLQKCHKRFSKNCLIDSNSQTIELKNFVAMMLKLFTSSIVWYTIILWTQTTKWFTLHPHYHRIMTRQQNDISLYSSLIFVLKIVFKEKNTATLKHIRVSSQCFH